MQYDVDTPESYLKTIENDWRKDTLLYLRKVILRYAQINESIEYKMLAYKIKDYSLFHLNAQKNYVSLYVGNTSKIDPEDDLLSGLDHGKGCIRFNKQVNPSKTGINQFIDKTISLYNEGRDLNC